MIGLLDLSLYFSVGVKTAAMKKFYRPDIISLKQEIKYEGLLIAAGIEECNHHYSFEGFCLVFKTKVRDIGFPTPRYYQKPPTYTLDFSYSSLSAYFSDLDFQSKGGALPLCLKGHVLPPF